MSMDWFDQNSGGSGAPGVYFGEVGHKVVGRIVGTPKRVDTQFGERLVIELVATGDSTALKGKKGADGKIVDGDEVTVWTKPGAMAAAIRDAVQEAGATGLSDGDTLALAFSDTRDTGKAEPVKLYVARYTPAKAAVSLDSLV